MAPPAVMLGVKFQISKCNTTQLEYIWFENSNHAINNSVVVFSETTETPQFLLIFIPSLEFGSNHFLTFCKNLLLISQQIKRLNDKKMKCLTKNYH